jgi:hypothetical protein
MKKRKWCEVESIQRRALESGSGLVLECVFHFWFSVVSLVKEAVEGITKSFAPKPPTVSKYKMQSSQ